MALATKIDRSIFSSHEAYLLRQAQPGERIPLDEITRCGQCRTLLQPILKPRKQAWDPRKTV